MSKKAIMFDMDGVLVKSEYCMRHSAILALKEWGLTAEHDDFIEFTGMGEDSFIGGVVRKHGGEYVTEMKIRAYEIYDQLAGGIVEVTPGTKEMLMELKKRGYRISVASAADLVKVRINLRCIGVTPEDFEAVVTGSDVEKKKPHPEIYLKTAAKLGEDPTNCIVIEDAVAGVTAGCSAGAVCVGVPGTFTLDELKEAGARYTVNSITELPDIIDSI
ncbi:MAG: HAD family phosphatase [Oscillospiraceae bacterium]|nr:HAD family phosphatase [Oscillospiraceae bacterium]MBQ9938488.1 HAD family phosphatase [Oscillospiraceae bacterium]